MSVRLHGLRELLLGKVKPIQVDQLLSVPRFRQILCSEEVSVIEIQV